MAAKTDIFQTNISAGQQLEFWRLASNPNSHVNTKTFQAFLEARNPFANHVTPDDVKLTLTITSSTIAEMITAGKYGWINDDIPKKFEFDSLTIGEWEFKFISAGKSISSEAAKKLCEADGFQAASIEHLLVFGAMFPEEQKKNPIVALGSVCKFGGNRRVSELWFSDDRRNLGLPWWSNDWCDYVRFLAVRKV